MRRIIQRDRGVLITAWVLLGGFVLTVAGWVVWMIGK
jgi:hypothetical protein